MSGAAIKTVCSLCRKSFTTTGMRKVCPVCDNNMEDYFQAIKEFIRENPGTSVAVVCSALNIPPALVKYYLRQERLELVGGDSFLKCIKCQKSISSGRYCKQCESVALRAEMSGTLMDSSDEKHMQKEVTLFHTKRTLGKKK